MHLMMEEARPEKIRLPNLADAAGIHGAIAKGAQAVVDGKIDYKQASIFGILPATGIEQRGQGGFRRKSHH
jgi:hypothetical protein